MKDCPEDVDINLAGETKHFLAYITEMQPKDIYTITTSIKS
jgi:hypothetical protein